VSPPSAAVIPREEVALPARTLWARLPLVGAGLAALGLILIAVAAPGHVERALAAWLVAFVFFLSLALGALYFALIHTAMQGAWGVVVRRVAENAAATIPVFALLFVPVALGLPHLYSWSRPEVVASDSLLQWKAPYLNVGFFLIRAAVYFAIWSAIALWFRRLSRQQDDAPDESVARRLRRWSGPALIPLGLTHSFAAVDWLMSLDPHWYSTIFGVYAFSGALVGGFAFIALAVVGLRRVGSLPGVFSAEHLHDLGKLLFAFTAFWAYIAFSQYLLIWYGNIPEETVWFRDRLGGGWLTLSAVLAVGHFVVPFFFLLPRSVKRNAPALAVASLWMLVMHLLDIYWLVVPSLPDLGVAPALVDFGALVAVGGIFLGIYGWLLRGSPLVPIGDPRLAESMAFENV
jgi:hypothetical protein